MSRPRSRRTVPLATLLAALAVAVAGCSAAAPAAVPATVTAGGVQHIEVAYAGGAVTGSAQRYAVPVGSTVELVVSSDVADEVHVHGYDRKSFVTAGASTTLRWEATLPGVFDVELEQRGTPLASLQVS
jgi:heme/copper-type cytochrome/quinol oxidase subunit 2